LRENGFEEWCLCLTKIHCFGNKIGTQANSNDLRQGSLSTCPRARGYHTVSQKTLSIHVCRICKCGSHWVRVWGWGPWRSGFAHRPHPPTARDPSCPSIARDWLQPCLGSTAEAPTLSAICVGGVETALHCFGNKVGTQANSNDLGRGPCPHAPGLEATTQFPRKQRASLFAGFSSVGLVG